MDDFQVLTRTVLPKEFISCFVVSAIHHSPSHLKNIFILQNLKSTISTFSINDISFNVFRIKSFLSVNWKIFFNTCEYEIAKGREGRLKIFYQDLTGVWIIFFGPIVHLFIYTYQVKNLNIIFKRKNSDISEKLQ